LACSRLIGHFSLETLMREVFEFRIFQEFAFGLSNPKVGRLLGEHVRQVMIAADDPLIAEIGRANSELYPSIKTRLFAYWQVTRNYTSTEIEAAELFRMFIGATFDSAGEECGTQYDETCARVDCRAGAEQISDLFLDLRKLPRCAERIYSAPTSARERTIKKGLA
jgi:hypothetical protein